MKLYKFLWKKCRIFSFVWPHVCVVVVASCSRLQPRLLLTLPLDRRPQLLSKSSVVYVRAYVCWKNDLERNLYTKTIATKKQFTSGELVLNYKKERIIIWDERLIDLGIFALLWQYVMYYNRICSDNCEYISIMSIRNAFNTT